jgi:hypothetical protein
LTRILEQAQRFLRIGSETRTYVAVAGCASRMADEDVTKSE